jgi:NADPH:quinone reductase-like Zn-dependent oxidoreductase
MKAIVQDTYGSAEVLELRDIDPPEIGDDEVLVRVRAAGVNPADWAIMSGLPYIALKRRVALVQPISASTRHRDGHHTISQNQAHARCR